MHHVSPLWAFQGIDMVNLPRIFVRDAVSSIVQNVTPPIVGFKYMKTIAGKLFNQKKVVEDLRRLDVPSHLPNISTFRYNKILLAAMTPVYQLQAQPFSHSMFSSSLEITLVCFPRLQPLSLVILENICL